MENLAAGLESFREIVATLSDESGGDLPDLLTDYLSTTEVNNMLKRLLCKAIRNINLETIPNLYPKFRVKTVLEQRDGIPHSRHSYGRVFAHHDQSDWLQPQGSYPLLNTY